MPAESARLLLSFSCFENRSDVKLSSRDPEPQMGHVGLFLGTANDSACHLPHCVNRRKGAEGLLDLMVSCHITLGDLDF